MGIDKGDIDLIIHFNIPLSLGDYYQQAGRAGLDGGDAHCVKLYNEIDDSDWSIRGQYIKSFKQNLFVLQVWK